MCIRGVKGRATLSELIAGDPRSPSSKKVCGLWMMALVDCHHHHLP